MPWTETDPMLERTKFALAHQEGLYSTAELSRRFGISRQTAYKWLRRFEELGRAGLYERSRAPHACPHRTGEELERLLLETRKAHPSWGPRKILSHLERRHPHLPFPAASTVGDLLKRSGLVEPRRRRRKWKHPGGSHIHAGQANDLWCADFKGEFKTTDGVYCYPLTVTDAFSRFILGCHGLLSVKQIGVFPVFERLFREHGLPLAIRTDNGVPFATTAIHGLSKLSVWWTKLGVAHQRIAPGRPEQNGRHERMHRTLKAETTRPPARDLEAQQGRFDAFRREFNEERPHEGLGQRTPASAYASSPRPMPEQVPPPEYPEHMEVRQVNNAGTFRFKGKLLFISDALEQERIALEETGDGVWSIYFYDVLLAKLDERDFKLHP